MKSIGVLSFALGTALFLFACDDPSVLPGSTVSRVTVTLPAYPPERPVLRGWLMVRDGTAPVYLAADAGDVTLDLDKNQCIPVLFYPLTGDAAGELPLRFFAPAGCVYPGSTAAAWRDGFASRLCFDLLTQASPDFTAEQRRSFCMRFNWQRFSREMAAMEQAAAAESTEPEELSSIIRGTVHPIIRGAVQSNAAFNPWNLDRLKIITAICAGKFTKTTLKVSAKPVTVSLAAGTAPQERPLFYQPYILAPPLVPVGDGGDGAGDDAAASTVTVPYQAGTTGGNILFDPKAGAVLLVKPKDAKGKSYRLAVLPLSHYTWSDE